MARETWVQSQVESYQRLKKWYLMPPYLTLSIKGYRSRVKWSNPEKGVASSPTPWCSKLSKREPSGHPRLWSPTLLFYLLIKPWMYFSSSFWYVLTISLSFLSFYTLAFVGFLILSKDAFFHVVFLCYWLPGSSTFGSWFGWYSLIRCFYIGGNKVFISVIQSMSLRCLL